MYRERTTWKYRLDLLRGVVVILGVGIAGAEAQTTAYQQTNLVSDGSVTAKTVDNTLINPWGMAIGQQTPVWLNDAGSGFSAVYDSGGGKQFAVTIPAAAGSSKPGTPTGIAFNTSQSDFLLPGSTAATFLFATLDGTISGWNANTPNGVLAVDNSTSGAVYTGLAIASSGAGQVALAADFHGGKVAIFDNKFAPATLPGQFVDPNIPAGFAPFGIHTIGGKVYVTYAEQPSSPGSAATGAGLGYVSVFDSNGNFLNRVASGGKPECTLGCGARARRIRAVWRQSPHRQLRRWDDQCIRCDDLRSHRTVEGCYRRGNREWRAVGAGIWTAEWNRRPEYLVLRRRNQWRERRPLRSDHRRAKPAAGGRLLDRACVSFVDRCCGRLGYRGHRAFCSERLLRIREPVVLGTAIGRNLQLVARERDAKREHSQLHDDRRCERNYAVALLYRQRLVRAGNSLDPGARRSIPIRLFAGILFPQGAQKCREAHSDAGRLWKPGLGSLRLRRLQGARNVNWDADQDGDLRSYRYGFLGGDPTHHPSECNSAMRVGPQRCARTCAQRKRARTARLPGVSARPAGPQTRTPVVVAPKTSRFYSSR